MGSTSTRIVKIDANVYSFVSGIFVAVSINLYTGVFASDQISSRWGIVMISALFTFVSSVCWIALSWICTPIQMSWITTVRAGADAEAAYQTLVVGEEKKLVSLFLAAMFSALVGLGVLLVRL
jgi:hypothetical protein